MSAVTKSWAPSKTNPVAAAQRKKKILLVVLAVLFVSLLAFEVPRIMHRGSAGAASAPDTSTGLVTDQVGNASDTADAANATTAATTASAAQTTAQTGSTATPAATPSGTAPVSTPAKVSKATILAIRHRPAKDPFVPLLGETTAAATGASTTGASTQVATPAVASPAKHESTPVTVATPSVSTTPGLATTPAVTSTPTVTSTPAAHPAATKASSGTKAHGTSKHTKHAVAPKVVPTVALVNTGGKKQAVAVGEYFKAGNLWFQLVALQQKSMELAVVGGGFTDGKQTITVRLNDPVTLYNTATGVEYPLRLTRATTGITTTSQPAPGNAATAATATPAGDQSTTTPTTPTTTATDPAASATTTS